MLLELTDGDGLDGHRSQHVLAIGKPAVEASLVDVIEGVDMLCRDYLCKTDRRKEETNDAQRGTATVIACWSMTSTAGFHMLNTWTKIQPQIV